MFPSCDTGDFAVNNAVVLCKTTFIKLTKSDILEAQFHLVLTFFANLTMPI